MIDLSQALSIHNALIESFGGSKGTRDLGALESALQRPYSTFDKQELYPTPIDKASAIVESIVTNHPFIDGNKRTGYVLMRVTLMQGGFDISASQKSKYDFIIAISRGEMNFDKIRNWIKLNTKKTST